MASGFLTRGINLHIDGSMSLWGKDSLEFPKLNLEFPILQNYDLVHF